MTNNVPQAPWIIGPYGMVWVASDVEKQLDGRWKPTCEEPRIVISLGSGESELGEFIVGAVNAHAQLVDSVIEMLEPYHDMESADLFARLPGEEAQRVVRARAVLSSLKVSV